MCTFVQSTHRYILIEDVGDLVQVSIRADEETRLQDERMLNVFGFKPKYLLTLAILKQMLGIRSGVLLRRASSIMSAKSGFVLSRALYRECPDSKALVSPSSLTRR